MNLLLFRYSYGFTKDYKKTAIERQPNHLDTSFWIVQPTAKFGER